MRVCVAALVRNSGVCALIADLRWCGTGLGCWSWQAPECVAMSTAACISVLEEGGIARKKRLSEAAPPSFLPLPLSLDLSVSLSPPLFHVCSVSFAHLALLRLHRGSSDGCPPACRYTTPHHTTPHHTHPQSLHPPAVSHRVLSLFFLLRFTPVLALAIHTAQAVITHCFYSR